MTLTKAMITEAISEQIEYTKTKSIEVIETLLELMKKSLESGDNVMISGFGKFCVKQEFKR